MRSLGSLAVVSGLLLHQAYAAALPSLDIAKTISDLVEGAVNPVADSSDAFVKAVADGIASDVPLRSFGDLMARPLEEMPADPDSINKPTTYTNGAIAESGAGSDFEEPEMKATDAAAASCTSPGTRVEWRNYSQSDRKAFVSAISCLTNRPSAGTSFAPSTSRYEDFVVTHQKMTPQVHGNAIFIHWHRYFLHTFEQALRTECNFNSAMPWWDETKDSGRFQSAPLFTQDYFGTLDTATGGSGTCVKNGQFANLMCHIGPGSSNVKHCLSRAVNETMTAQSSTSYVNYCAQATTTGSFSSCAETGPHAWAHNGIGSVMADVYASPSDPIFFMHHLFVDHELASWQQVNTARRTSITSACLDGSNPCSNPLTLNTVLNMNGLSRNAVVGDVINTQAGLLCYKYDYYS